MTPEAELAVIQRFNDAPKLWPFVIAAGEMGFEQARIACATRTLPSEVVAKLSALGYGVERLPTLEDFDDLLRACRLIDQAGGIDRVNYARLRPEARRALAIAKGYGLIRRYMG